MAAETVNAPTTSTSARCLSAEQQTRARRTSRRLLTQAGLIAPRRRPATARLGHSPNRARRGLLAFVASALLLGGTALGAALLPGRPAVNDLAADLVQVRQEARSLVNEESRLEAALALAASPAERAALEAQLEATKDAAFAADAQARELEARIQAELK